MARLDFILREKFPSLTRRQVVEAIENRLVVFSHGAPISKGTNINDSDDIDCRKLVNHMNEVSRGNTELRFQLIHDSAEWCAIDKPQGTPCNPISLFDRDTVSNWAMAQTWWDKSEFPVSQPAVCPHRLDTDTSGIQIVAKTQNGYNKWRRLFNGKEVRKEYLAWCWGTPNNDEWKLENRIAHHPTDKARMVIVDFPNSLCRPPVRLGVAQAKKVKQLSDRFLVRVCMETGVTHQIRVQLSGIGHPLIGDKRYDSHFTERKVSVSHHLLRASGLETNEVNIETNCSEFENLFKS